MILGLFPGFMSMIAVYYILKAVGLSEGSMIRVALIMVYSAGSGLGFYIAKGFFDTIPKALDEAAFLDGATKFQVFTKVTIPLSKPIIVYTVLTSFLGPPSNHRRRPKVSKMNLQTVHFRNFDVKKVTPQTSRNILRPFYILALHCSSQAFHIISLHIDKQYRDRD